MTLVGTWLAWAVFVSVPLILSIASSSANAVDNNEELIFLDGACAETFQDHAVALLWLAHVPTAGCIPRKL